MKKLYLTRYSTNTVADGELGGYVDYETALIAAEDFLKVGDEWNVAVHVTVKSYRICEGKDAPSLYLVFAGDEYVLSTTDEDEAGRAAEEKGGSVFACVPTGGYVDMINDSAAEYGYRLV